MFSKFSRIPVRPRLVFFTLLLSVLSLTSYLYFNAPYTFFTKEPVYVVDPPRVLLVSAFFPLTKAKHSSSDYAIWLSKFLSRVNTHIYFFTSPDMAETIQSLRGNLPMTLNTSFSSPFEIQPLQGLEDRYYKMHELDTERDIHSPELYAVWSSKPYFLDQGMRNMLADGHHYDYAFWNDAGGFRDEQEFSDWPDGRRIGQIWEEGQKITDTPAEDLIFIPIWDGPGEYAKTWNESIGPVETGGSISEGSFFGGSLKAIMWWRQTFYAYHDHFLFDVGAFVGKDQTIINALLILFPKRFITVWQYDSQAPLFTTDPDYFPLGKCGGSWWYYQFFVASESDRNKMSSIWDPPQAGDANKTKGCSLTRLLSIYDVNKRKLGSDWEPPKATLDIYASHRP